MISLTLCKKTQGSSHGYLKVLLYIKDILTNESNTNAYKVRDRRELSIFYALHYINVQQVPGSEIKEMFEIKDAYMINLNATGTPGHCLYIQTYLKSQPFH